MKLRLRYADVASTLALVIALGGTAYAAIVVTTNEIKDETILSRDVRNGGLTTADVQDGTLRSADVLDGTIGLVDISAVAKAALKGQQGPPGTNGTNGVDGTNGIDGVDGSDGVSGYTVVAGEWVNGVVGDYLNPEAFCPAGKKPISGGYTANTGSKYLSVYEDQPVAYVPGYREDLPNGAEGWRIGARAENDGIVGSAWSIRAWVTCATVS